MSDDLNLQVSTLSSQASNLLSLVQAIQTEIPKLKADLAKLASSLESHKEEVKRVLGENSKLASLVATIREEFARNLTSSHQSLLNAVETKSKALIAVIEDHEATKARLNSLHLKMDDVSLDAKNAVLKANNNDILVQLNRKKLENIQLMVKNQELNK